METTRPAVMSLDEFMQTYSDAGPFELIDGERVPVSPQNTRSARFGGRLFMHLSLFVSENSLGEVFIEAPFVLTLEEGENWVRGSRVPDVMFVTAARLEQLARDVPDWEDKPLVIVPDLAVEIVSPTDRFTNISKKVAGYLQDGVRLVWIVDPQQCSIVVHTQGSSQQTTLTESDTLDGGAVLPGFSLPLNRLFAE